MVKLHGLGKAHHNWLGEFLGKGADEIEGVCTKASGAMKQHASAMEQDGIGAGEGLANVVGKKILAKGLSETVIKSAGGFAEDLKAGSKSSTLATALIDTGVDIYDVAEGKMSASAAVEDVGVKTGIAGVSNEIGRVVEEKFPHNKMRSLNDPLEKLADKVKKPLGEAKKKAAKTAEDLLEKAKTKIKGGENDVKNVNELMEDDLEGVGEQAAKLGTKEGIEAAGEAVVEEVGEVGLPTILADSGDIALTAELVKDGAVGGSVVPGAGTIIGAAAGLAVGIGVSVGLTELMKTKEGQKINKDISDKMAEAGDKAKEEFSKLGKKLKHDHETTVTIEPEVERKAGHKAEHGHTAKAAPKHEVEHKPKHKTAHEPKAGGDDEPRHYEK